MSSPALYTATTTLTEGPTEPRASAASSMIVMVSVPCPWAGPPTFATVRA